jgi:hypothetical protein
MRQDKVTPSGAASKDPLEQHRAVDPSAVAYMLLNMFSIIIS